MAYIFIFLFLFFNKDFNIIQIKLYKQCVFFVNYLTLNKTCCDADDSSGADPRCIAMAPICHVVVK